MHRRDFLGAGAAGLATSAFGGYFVQAAEEKKLRVGLIGCGWYGKSDLCRLIQVAPVEVVSLCDVDQKMLAEAADLAAARQASPRSRSSTRVTSARKPRRLPRCVRCTSSAGITAPSGACTAIAAVASASTVTCRPRCAA